MPVRNPGFSDPVTVYSNRSNSSAVGFFFPLLAQIESAPVKYVRPSIDLRAVTSAVTVRVAYQLSDDGVTWPDSDDHSNTHLLATAGQDQLPAAPGEGATYAGAWEDISTNLTKKFIRFGVWVFNTSGTSLEFATAAIRVETKGS